MHSVRLGCAILAAVALTLLAKLWLTLSQVDYGKLADLAGLKNPASASAVWMCVRKKLGASYVSLSRLSARDVELLGFAFQSLTVGCIIQVSSKIQHDTLSNPPRDQSHCLTTLSSNVLGHSLLIGTFDMLLLVTQSGMSDKLIIY